jgi:hypothetical protein
MSRVLFTYTIEVDDVWFKRFEQYEYTGTIMKAVVCTDCGVKNKYKVKKHYQIEIDGVTYDIPEDAVVEYNETYPLEYVDKLNYLYEKYSDNIVDYVKETKRLLGIDTTLKVDYSQAYLDYMESEKRFFASTNAAGYRNTEEQEKTSA